MAALRTGDVAVCPSLSWGSAGVGVNGVDAGAVGGRKEPPPPDDAEGAGARLPPLEPGTTDGVPEPDS